MAEAKRLVIFGDSIAKGVMFQDGRYHLCRAHDFDALAQQGVRRGDIIGGGGKAADFQQNALLVGGQGGVQGVGGGGLGVSVRLGGLLSH